MRGQFRVTVWDPYLILGQIVCVQACFYVTYGALLILAGLTLGVDPSLNQLFSYKALNFSDRTGFTTVVCYLVNALPGSLCLWWTVKRTKQCLDFATTCYLLHLLLSWMYGSFPSSPSWWILTLAGVTIMCVCAEFLCLRTELKDIPLLGGKVEI